MAARAHRCPWLVAGVALLALGLLLVAAPAEPAAACCDPPANGCCGSATGGCFKCRSGDSGGEGDDGSHAPGPPPPTSGPGATPGPGSTPQPPAATATPPAGLPAHGQYRTTCVISGADGVMPGCPSFHAVVLWWCVRGGDCHVIRARCAAEGECSPVTPTPRASPPPPPPNVWPCDDVPNVYPGGIDQTCDRWVWDLAVQVLIPPAQVLRNPWPRSLVGLPTKIWYTGEPNRAEAFSAGRAYPCAVDHGAAYGDLDDVPACPPPVGAPDEGTRVNLQLGVAWQRWRQGSPAVYGYTPPYASLITVDDREWNISGATQGAFLEHTFETSSYGLTANGPRWNPACQERDCACDERVAAWDAPAYQGGVQTWWYPQWTWRYDELQCTRRSWDDCFWRDSAPLGGGYRGCASGDHAGEANWYQRQRCSEWRWRAQTGPLFGCSGEQQGAWCVYDLRRLGSTPVLSWAAAQTAGADAAGSRCGSFTPGLAIPVIELQSVLTP
jgi:hypothetical protein